MGKTVLITGASSGIGYQLALQYANSGAKVICIARNRKKLERLKSSNEENIAIIDFDLNSIHLYNDLLKKIKSITNKIDVLFNNAGALINKPFEEFTSEEFDSIVGTNFKAPFFLIQKLLPLILMSEEKSIINIGSVGGVMYTDKFPGLSIYSSSKGAISILTECLAKELSNKEVTVNCLALGAVKTEMLEKAFPGYIPNTSSEKMSKMIFDFESSNKHLVNGKVIQLGGVNV